MAAGPSNKSMMSGSALRFDLTTDPEMKVLSFAISRSAEEISDFTELFRSYDPLFRAAMMKHFVTEGRYGLGHKWAALSPAYKAWKEEHYPGRPIGVLRGHLRASMTGGAGYSAKVSPGAASYGMESGPAMEYGQHFSERRPVVRMPKTEGRIWGKVAHEWMYDQALQAGWGRL